MTVHFMGKYWIQIIHSGGQYIYCNQHPMIATAIRIKPLYLAISIYEITIYSIISELWMLIYWTYENRSPYPVLYGINTNCPIRAAFNSSNTQRDFIVIASSVGLSELIITGVNPTGNDSPSFSITSCKCLCDNLKHDQ